MRLEDVAEVVLGADTYDQDVRMSGQQAVFMGVWVLPNANSLDVIAARPQGDGGDQATSLPTGMEASVAFDSTKYIDNAIHEVTQTLLETILHRHGRDLPVPRLVPHACSSRSSPSRSRSSAPSSSCRRSGFTLNLLTLLAIVLSVGLVVDDAIVVVENVERHVREGKTPVRRGDRSARASSSARSSR